MSGRAVVVGGGLGGLATALRLRARGWDVTVCEAGASFGGKMNRLSRGGYTFDTGPSLITMPWVFADLFRAAGSCLERHLDLVPLERLADYIYPDGTRFTYSPVLHEWLAVLERIAPGDRDGFLRFMELGARLWEVSRQTFMRRTPFDLPGRGDARVLRHMSLRYGWGNYHRMVEAHFRSPYLRQLFDRYPTYVGSSPYRSPATLAVIPYLEWAYGGYYVRGGLYRIVESLVALAKSAGVELCLRARVTRIVSANGRVQGVQLASGDTMPADVVVMNGDEATLGELLDSPHRKQRARTRSMSGFVMLVGVKRLLPEWAAHTVFFSGDYRREFAQIFDERRFPDDPTVYVNIPSRSDYTVSPEGSETLFIMANSPPRSDSWSASETAEARRRVWERLHRGGFPHIEDDIEVEDIWTPQRIEETYLMPGGAIYGSDSHGWRNAFVRPRNRHSTLRGLYLVGGSTHPGGGTPTVLLSAEITSGLIERHERS